MRRGKSFAEAIRREMDNVADMLKRTIYSQELYRWIK
jgi:hypothetical protein